MAIKDKKISVVYPGRDVTSLSDRPNQDGLTAAQLKARFDQLNKELFPKYNDLIDELNDVVLPLKADKLTTVNGHPLSENVVVTKADVGLGNADNTSDADKPLSTASTNALALKADKSITVNGHALSEDVVVSKADVGLGNADNTSDANKPVSTAQAEALALKADKSATYTKTEMQTSGSSLMHWDNLTNKPNFGDFHWKAPVANRASLPLTDNVLGDNRVVLDDGDGKQAVYTCIAITGDVDAQWSKVADVDWMTEEQTRITQELARVSAENARASAEGLRVTAEQGRVSAEGLRATAEGLRVSAEGLRVSAESTRVTQETGRVNAESVRESSELLRIENEVARNTFVEYSGSTAYQAGNKVSYLGSSYVAKSNTTGNLPTNTTYWLLIAQKGDNTTAEAITYDNSLSELDATNGQDAIDELDAKKSSKLFATNLVTNGDFSNGTTGWDTLASINTLDNESLINTGNGTSASPRAIQSITGLVPNNIYYMSGLLTSKSNSVTSLELRIGNLAADAVATKTSPTQDVTYKLSGVKKFSGSQSVVWILHSYTTTALANGSAIKIDDVIVIDLTATFGDGNEPTKEQMDWIFTERDRLGLGHLNGTQELLPMVSLLNLINMKANIAQEAWITPTLLNGATTDASYPFRYRVTSYNTLQFRGQLSNLVNATRFVVLPTTHRTNYYAKIRGLTNGTAKIVPIILDYNGFVSGAAGALFPFVVGLSLSDIIYFDGVEIPLT